MSQPPPLCATSFQRKEGECAFPPHRHFERMREIFFVRGQEKVVRWAVNGKHRVSCDWGARKASATFPIAKPFPRIVISSESEKSFSFAVRGDCEDGGERETPCFMQCWITVLHADGITQENGNGQRKRSLGCARDDEMGWHISHCFSIPQRKPTSAPTGHLLPEEGGRARGIELPFLAHRLFECLLAGELRAKIMGHPRPFISDFR